MNKFVAIVLSIAVVLGATIPASAAEWYTHGQNGRQTYNTDRQPGYNAPPPRRQYHYVPRQYVQPQYVPRHHYHRDSAAASFGLGVGIGVGIAVGAAIADAQRREHSRPMSPKEHCQNDNGIWVWNPDVRQEVCALPY